MVVVALCGDSFLLLVIFISEMVAVTTFAGEEMFLEDGDWEGETLVRLSFLFTFLALIPNSFLGSLGSK